MITRNCTKIGVVDSHPIVRYGLAALLNREDDLEVCFVADDGKDALAILEIERPDLIIAEATFCHDSCVIELIREVTRRFGKIPILVLSMHDEHFFAERVLRAGGRGYLMKNAKLPQLVGAIRKVLAGETYLSPAMAELKQRNNGGGKNRLGGLTDREFEIFELIGEGRKSREIAELLHISPKTVETHRGHIREKLGLTKGGGLVQFASQWFAVESGLTATA
ncbi:MAG: response regulator transcription factor [Akkermansiaceae bacterium]|nr:response regulator transcription factor [Akkermansiaceae bacterium]NNM29123.1 response regulator transcription factor [Akkermansiaceae bacterium]